MTDSPDETTTDGIEADSPADLSSPDPAETATATPDPTRAVTRKGAAVAIAGCIVAGGLIGWLSAAAFGEDDEPVSFQGSAPEGQGEWHGGYDEDGEGYPGPRGPEGFPGEEGEGGYPGNPEYPGEGGYEGQSEIPGYEGDDNDSSGVPKQPGYEGDDNDSSGQDEAPSTTEPGN